MHYRKYIEQNIPTVGKPKGFEEIAASVRNSKDVHDDNDDGKGNAGQT